MREQAPTTAAPAPITPWDDARVQKVYEVLTNDNYPPQGSTDHWEGWKARLIVDALFSGDDVAVPPPAQGGKP